MLIDMNTNHLKPNPGELISAGGVIFQDGKILLVSSKRNDYISLPKGRQNTDETIEETALREVAEETGYTAAIIAPLGFKTFTINWDKTVDGEYTKTIHMFLMELMNINEVPTPRQESHEDYLNFWVPINSAKRIITEAENMEQGEKNMAIEFIERTIAILVDSGFAIVNH